MTSQHDESSENAEILHDDVSSSSSSSDISQKSVKSSPENHKDVDKVAASPGSSFKKKPKAEKSAIRDPAKGIWCCRYCGWTYPNSHPSAKRRREHRKHCSKFQSVHEWLGKSSSDSDGSVNNGCTVVDETEGGSVMADHGRTNGFTMEETPGEVDDLESGNSNACVEGEGIYDEQAGRTIVAADTQEIDGTKGNMLEKQENETSNGTNVENMPTQEKLENVNQQIFLQESSEERDNEGAPDNLAKTSQSSEDIQSSKKKIEYAEIQGETSLSKADAGDGDDGENLRKILHEQTTHDLLCPNCGSCITRRVILRKRKRIGTPTREREQEKLPKLETRAEEEPHEEHENETEAWGCLACFSVFFRRVRSTRLDGFNNFFLKRKASTEANENDEAGCLSFLVPDFTWDGKGNRPPDTQTDRAFPALNLPWTGVKNKNESTSERTSLQEGEIREVDVVIDLTQPRPPPTPGIPSSELSQPNGVPYTHFSCMPILFPEYWKEGEHVQEKEHKAGSNCLPIVLPAYWGSYIKEGSEKAGLNCFSWETTDAEVESEEALERTDERLPPSEDEPQTNEKETTSSCLPFVFPSYKWGSTVAPTLQGDKPKDKEVDCISFLRSGNDISPDVAGDAVESNEALERTDEGMPVSLPKEAARKQYISRETSIHAWIKTITSVVTVKPARKNKQETLESVQVGSKTSYVDMKITDQPEAYGKRKTEVLTTTPSTGWALLDALEKEGTKHTEDNKPVVEDVDEENEEDEIHLVRKKTAPEIVEEGSSRPKPEDEEILTDDLNTPLLSSSEKEVNIEDLLEALSQHQYSNVLVPQPKVPVSATVAVKTPGSLVQVTGHDSKETIETAIAIAEDIGAITQEERSTGESPEYVKSIVYGGLDISLASLAVVSSAAGANTKTINLLAMSLANLFATFITLLISIGNLYRSDRSAFQQKIGKSLRLNGSIAVVSFLVFGSVAPFTYVFSFRTLDDRDYKFAATALASVACLVFLGFCKAYVQKKRYLNTIVNLIVTGFAAAMAGYFVGDYIKRWLEKLGFGDQAGPPSAPPATSPLRLQNFPGLKNERSLLGRRGSNLLG